MRLIHAADLHLDSPLLGLDEAAGCPIGLVRGASRQALDALVGQALALRVDAVVIAGDVWDGGWRDVRTGIEFARQMKRLDEAGIPVVLIRGNHDAESRIARALPLPPNVTVLGAARPETVLSVEGLAVHGQSFAQPEETRNLALAYPPALPGRFNLGLLHTSLTGREGHAPYAPATPADLARLGYDYWALGHVHAHEVIAGLDVPAVFAGCLQGRHIRETGAKGFVLIEVEGGRVAAHRLVPVDVVRWTRLELDLSGLDGLAAVEDAVDAALAEAAAAAAGLPLGVRLVLGVGGGLERRLRADRQRLEDQLREQAGRHGPVWLEAVRLTSLAPPPAAATAPPPALGGDARAVLERLVAGAGEDAALVAELERALRPLLDRLPREVAGAWLDETGTGLAAPALAELLADAGALIDAGLD